MTNAATRPSRRGRGHFDALPLPIALIVGCCWIAGVALSAKPAPVKLEVRIAAVDGRGVAKGAKPEVGKTARLSGSVTDPKASVCVLVHPKVMADWLVQPPPGPLVPGGPGRWQWEAKAWFGSSRIGKGDEYEVLVIAEPASGLCAKGGQVALGALPATLSRSEVLLVKRTRD